MARLTAHVALLLAFALVAASASASVSSSSETAERLNGAALLQAWETGSSTDTPVTRVVNLLKEMHKTLQKEMDEDEALYKELSCWCNDGNWEKSNSIEASTAKISELNSAIESGTAKSAELNTNIKELEAQVASDKNALAEATALREKQLAEFHSTEVDSVQAIENLKAALEVLAKHHDAPPESTVAGGAIFKSERDSWSMLEVRTKDLPWSAEHEAARGERSLDDFMRRNGFGEDAPVTEDIADRKPVATHKFLQQEASGSAQTSSWSSDDSALVKRALKSAAAFVQAHQGSSYFPAYNSQSGEIVGVLKQLKEEMEGDLSEAQQRENARAAAFAELRAAKSQQIAEGEKMSEQKEDELAITDNNLAEAKEDLGQEQKVLEEDQAYLKNLKETCANANKNFEERKAARLQEIQAVSETIGILQGDEARDAMSSTFKGFLQISSNQQTQDTERRKKAAEALRQAARRSHNPELSILATSVELDAFTKVKQAIDNMISMLRTQQTDEVKKNDWCKAEIHDNEMATAKKEDQKADLEAQIGQLASDIKALVEGIAESHRQIAQLQLDLQRATEDRKAENIDFQKTVADQTVTVEVLKKALDKLATYYDLLQQGQRGSSKQTPPMPQKEYAPSKGATGVMEMIEKLIHESQDLRTESRKGEIAAQQAYEALIRNTNGNVQALHKEIVSKSEAKAQASKDKLAAESNLADTERDLEGLSKYNSDLHAECDYLLRNFDVRQGSRGAEIEALQQAKQILSGASLS